ncbi:MAG: ankyrin repeat domain-containing protein [Elusimicrobiota bacterium]
MRPPTKLKTAAACALAVLLLGACGRTQEELTRDLYEAAAVGDAEDVRRLLRKNPALAKGSDIVFTRKSPLHVASEREVVTALLEAGADINAVDVMGLTPLHTAKRPEIVDILIAAGADVKAQGAVGATPLHMATFPNVAQALLKHGADIEAMSRDRGTPLYSQTLDGRFSIVEMLLHDGADVARAEPSSGRTPLHAAAAAGSTDIVELLLRSRADINAKDKAGDTPLCAAVRGDQLFTARLLLNKGARKGQAGELAKSPEMKRLFGAK